VRVSELGEFGLIDRLQSLLGADGSPDLIIGIGDDCAVWRTGSEYLLATTDTLVEGVHFIADQAPWEDIGWKALAVNISDIAAMGGVPMFALITLALPADTDVSDTDAMYAGLSDCATEYSVTIAGGDIVRADEFSITVAVMGRAQMRDGAPLLMRRDAARVGDVVAVTGTLGGSAAGLRRLKDGAAAKDPMIQRHLRPRPPLAAAQDAATLWVRCAIDVSDGLLKDIGHICERSGVGADIRAGDVPISDDVRQAYPEEALAYACGGGEDYEVVLVGTSGVIQAMADLRPGEIATIGRITEAPPGRVRLLDTTGAELEMATGWDHLGGRAPANS
jgi:thiamine-monophosphate kinase